MKFGRKSLISTLLAYVLVFVLTAGVLSVSVSASTLISDFIDDESAKAIALELTGGGQVTLCRLSYNEDAAEYDVGVLSGSAAYTIFLDAYTGEMERFTRETVTGTAAVSSIPPDNNIVSVRPNPVPQLSVSPVPVQQQVRMGNTTADEARRIALTHLGKGAVVRHETKKDCYKVCVHEGNWHYDVEVYFSGAVKKSKAREITFKGSKALAWNQSGIIGFDGAAGIARNRAGGGVVIENKLDHKSREGLVYKVKVVDGHMEHKIEMIAATGSIFKYEAKYKS